LGGAQDQSGDLVRCLPVEAWRVCAWTLRVNATKAWPSLWLTILGLIPAHLRGRRIAVPHQLQESHDH